MGPLFNSLPTGGIINPFPQSLSWAQMYLRSCLIHACCSWNETSLPLREHLGLCWSNHHHHPHHCRTGDLATGKTQPASWGCALQIQLMSVTTSIPESRLSSQVYVYNLSCMWENTWAQLTRGTCKPSRIPRWQQELTSPSLSFRACATGLSQSQKGQGNR